MKKLLIHLSIKINNKLKLKYIKNEVTGFVGRHIKFKKLLTYQFG